MNFKIALESDTAAMQWHQSRWQQPGRPPPATQGVRLAFLAGLPALSSRRHQLGSGGSSHLASYMTVPAGCGDNAGVCNLLPRPVKGSLMVHRAETARWR